MHEENVKKALKNALVSVIVPVYQVEKYLPRCIDSILAQSYPHFELILVDDGSPDRCGAICDAYAEKDSRIQVIHQENAKLSAARNAGLNAARGEWIALVDSDDWLHKDYLRVLLSGALEDTDLVICDCLKTPRDSEEDQEVLQAAFRSVSLAEIQTMHIASTRAWGRIVRRSTIGDLRYISGTEPAEDACFNELFFRKDMKYRITDAQLYYYCMRSDSTIHSHFGGKLLQVVDPLLARLEKIEDKDQRRRIILRCYKFVFSARYGEMYTDRAAEVRQKCRQILRNLHAYLPELDLKNRWIMGVFAACPWVYRSWRIHQDPSLLQFEKEKKAAARNAGKKSA